MKIDFKGKSHSLAHVMALAAKELYDENLLCGVGPAIENGFYQDFDYPFSEDDLPKIEARMREIIAEDIPFENGSMPIDEAIEYYKEKGQIYKVELLNDIKNKGSTKVKGKEEDENILELTKKGLVSIQSLGVHKDLCRGGHVASTGELKDIAFKLDRIAGAYWRGNEKNKMLTRIYGVAFPSQEELDKHYEHLEEIKKRDHRIIGRDLKIHMFSDLVGPGIPMYLPNGGVVVSEIEKLERSVQRKYGYKEVYSPHVALEEMYLTSGHLQWYKDSMFPSIDVEDQKYYLKPMNCPHHIQMYKNEKRSYRELPLRFAEFGNVYRYEKSGELGGLLRVRGFTQDDAHIFCRKDQVVDTFMEVVDLLNELFEKLGLKDKKYRLSLKDNSKDKYAGNDEQWNEATEMIRKALKRKNIDYFEAEGEAAFYGPKLDLIFKDAVDREWQISTIQVDFLQPQRFGLEYIDAEGKKQVPYMIHRAPFGSRERIMAILLEHYMGAYPTWLAPIQAKILPINDSCIDYAEEIKKEMLSQAEEYDLNLRIEVDGRKENLQKKIADASAMKAPYILIAGKREAENKQVSVRSRGKGDVGAVSKDEFIQKFIEEIRKRKVDLSY